MAGLTERTWGRWSRKAAAALAVLAAAACSDTFTSTPAGPGEEPESTLNIIEVDPAGPMPEVSSVSFYARRGKTSEGRIFLNENAAGGRREYIRLTIDKDALSARPDGTPFERNDSVLITIRVLDPARILFEMEPAGLRFSDANPAELRISYAPAAGDLDDDGQTGVSDDSVENHLAIWRQTTPNAPFVRLPSSVSRDSRTVRTELPGFSRYAIAY